MHHICEYNDLDKANLGSIGHPNHWITRDYKVWSGVSSKFLRTNKYGSFDISDVNGKKIRYNVKSLSVIFLGMSIYQYYADDIRCLDYLGYPTYTITKDGYLWSYRIRNWIIPNIDRGGYHIVKLQNDGQKFNTSIHRLVALSFLPNVDDKPEVNHIDCDKSNNDWRNLEWVLPIENVTHAINNNLIPRQNTRLSSDELEEIRGMINDGFTYTEIGRLTSNSYSRVSRIANGKSYRSK